MELESGGTLRASIKTNKNPLRATPARASSIQYQSSNNGNYWCRLGDLLPSFEGGCTLVASKDKYVNSDIGPGPIHERMEMTGARSCVSKLFCPSGQMMYVH